jgi:hypothetical protein
MPKIGDCCLCWNEEFDNQLLNIERKYRRYCQTHKIGGKTITYQVDWKHAEWDGALKGLPLLPRIKYSKRLTYLRKLRKDYEGFLAKRREFNKESLARYEAKHGHKRKNVNKRREIFKTLPEEFKKRHGWKPRGCWNEKQRDLLFKIVADYQNTSVDWISLMQDERVLKLPEKYHKDLHALRKYYWSLKCKNNGGEEWLERKRALARKYKEANKEVFYARQSDRRQIERDIVNIHLSTIMPRKT